MHLGKNKKFAFTMLDEDLNRRTLTESNLERDLGILVSNNLSWEDQVNSAVSKASRSLGLIKITFKKIHCSLFKFSGEFNLRRIRGGLIQVFKIVRSIEQVQLVRSLNFALNRQRSRVNSFQLKRDLVKS